MNGSIAEANMSIDDSMTILNGALNTINDEQPHLGEEIENELDFSTTIEQSSVPPTEAERKDALNKETIQRKSADLVEIEFAKQIAVEPTQAQIKKNAQAKVILSIQSIVEQAIAKQAIGKQAIAKQSGSKENEQANKTHRYDFDFWN